MSLTVYLNIQDSCPHCHRELSTSETVYEANITSNLCRMAIAAGLYGFLWEPQETGINLAQDLIEPLQKGLQKLVDAPDAYRTFNSPNGWGTYENFVRFVRNYLKACEDHPLAVVSISS